MQLDPPVPIAAIQKLGNVTIWFDKPLVDDVLDLGNWFGRWANFAFDVSAAIFVEPTKVQVTMAVVGADVGPDVITFDPPPFDVISQIGLVEADGFVDFPIT